MVILGKEEGLKEELTQIGKKMPAGLPLLCQCADITLHEIACWITPPILLFGFDDLCFSTGRFATLVAGLQASQGAREFLEAFVTSLGLLPVWIQDSAGLVLPRLVCSLANEAAFACGEGVADAASIDLAMKSGMSMPLGPIEWAAELGYGRVVRVLNHLHE